MSYPCGYRVTSLIINSQITEIGKEAFRGNQRIKVIVIENNIFTLEDKSFAYFNSLSFILYQWTNIPECGNEVFENNKLDIDSAKLGTIYHKVMQKVNFENMCYSSLLCYYVSVSKYIGWFFKKKYWNR